MILDARLLKTLKPVIEARLQDFASVPRKLWPRELLFCLLTPQSSPFNAERCLIEMEQRGLFVGALTLKEVERILGDSQHYIRFHKEKAKRVLAFLDNAQEIKKILCRDLDPKEEREVLVSRVTGLGWKEASHALRNIGRRNLAILDRHILRNLQRLHVIREIPKSLTERKYKEVEEAFLHFADQEGESIDVLDLFFWSAETGLIFK